MAYIYEHIDPVTNKTFYVGKGTKNRYTDLHNRNNHHLNKIKNLISKGFNMKDIAKITFDNLSDNDAFKKEVELIEYYGLENLCNYTPGGEGGSAQRIINEDDFKKLLKLGYNLRECGEALNIGSKYLNYKFFKGSTIVEYCKQNNIQYTLKMKLDEKQFIKLVKQNLNITDIAKKMNVAAATIKNNFYPNKTFREYCKDKNINHKSLDYSGNKNFNFKPFDKKYFKQLLKSGKNLREISVVMGFSHPVLCMRYKKEFGVTSLKEMMDCL